MVAPASSRFVVYTAIFGKRDVLLEPTYVPEDCDFVCFTDQSFESGVWEVRRVEPPVPGNPRRCSRHFKLLPHRYLSEYETSIWIDGNVRVTGDVTVLARKYLRGAHLAGFDHAQYRSLPSRSLADQTQLLLRPGQDVRNQESFESIRRQAQAYAKAGFPDDSGMLWTMLLIRRHNEPDVVSAMEAWWRELLEYTSRDQMSFNYVAWREKLAFVYIPLDGSNNEYIKRVGHFRPWHKKVIAYTKAFFRRIRDIVQDVL